MAFVLALLASGVCAAQTQRTVVWLDYGMPDHASDARNARVRALDLELDARGYVLLEARAGDPDAAPSDASSSLLARSGASAVVWLEADPERPVSWLFVRAAGRDGVVKSPLTHPPAAIDPQLLAIAAASLLDQTLREPSPAVVPPPAQAAARASAPPPHFTKTAEPVIVPLAEDEGPRVLFVQLGMLATFAAVSPDMETTKSEPASVDGTGFVPLPGLRLALGGWTSRELAVVSVMHWHFMIKPKEVGGNLSFGIETEWFFSGSHERGFGTSILFGAWMGRTETPVEVSSVELEHVQAGPFGARLGMPIRYRVMPGFAFVTTPSLGVRFPLGQVELELGVAAEHPF